MGFLEVIRERCGCELSVMERIERNVLKWFGHVERIMEEMLVKSVSGKCEGNRGKGRWQRRWEDKVKELTMGRGLSEREGMVLARYREAWGTTVYISE